MQTKKGMTPVERLLVAMQNKGLDPFFVFTLVLGIDRVANETSLGARFAELLVVTAGEASVTVDEMITAYRCLFYGTSVEGKLSVRKVKSTGVVVWKDSKKKNVLLLYLQSLEVGVPHMPTLVQVIYTGKDMRSGARVHHIFKNIQDAIVTCKEMFLSSNPPLAIMEVPNSMQGSSRFYVDWDMKLQHLVFLVGTHAERVFQARELALGAPAKISEIFMALGYISSDTNLQVVVKEGSRAAVGETNIAKISFHFIWNLYGTTSQMKELSNGLFTYLAKHGGTLSSILREGGVEILDIDNTNGYGSLVGIDMHPYSNPEQGLAMAFSRKHLHDPYTRFVEIMHITGGRYTFSEIPCPMIWMGRVLPLHNKPPDIWYVHSSNSSHSVIDQLSDLTYFLGFQHLGSYEDPLGPHGWLHSHRRAKVYWIEKRLDQYRNWRHRQGVFIAPTGFDRVWTWNLNFPSLTEKKVCNVSSQAPFGRFDHKGE
jgi:hypothetical protein